MTLYWCRQCRSPKDSDEMVKRGGRPSTQCKFHAAVEQAERRRRSPEAGRDKLIVAAAEKALRRLREAHRAEYDELHTEERAARGLPAVGVLPQGGDRRSRSA